jgi:uncharacterized protein
VTGPFQRRRSPWPTIVVAAVVLVLAAYLGAGYVVYDKLSTVGAPRPEEAANTPTRFTVSDSRWKTFDTTPFLMPRYQAVSFPSRGDHVPLAGWYVENRPGAPVVIVVHGIRESRHDGKVLTAAGMLARGGYNVLLFDLRNHGDSGRDGGRTSMGNREYRDVLGAWDWLIGSRHYSAGRIGVFAMSLGAGTSLTAFAQEPRLAALFADSPFANLEEIARSELARKHYPGVLWYSTVIVARAQGVDLTEHEPADAIRRARGRPIFIVHGDADRRISVGQTRELEALARSEHADLATWITRGVEHCGSEFVYTAGYEARLLGFFRRALRG